MQINYVSNFSGKDLFPFATATQIAELMRDFEQGVLKEFTPCNSKTLKDAARAIATVHAELMLIYGLVSTKDFLCISYYTT